MEKGGNSAPTVSRSINGNLHTDTPILENLDGALRRSLYYSRDGHTLGSAITRPRPNHKPASRIIHGQPHRCDGNEVNMTRKSASLERKSSALPDVYCLYLRSTGKFTCIIEQEENVNCVDCLLFKLLHVRDRLLHHFHNRKVNHSEELRKG